MASAPIRDQVGDHLITSLNSALVLIDYQPSQFETVRSTDPDLLLKNIVWEDEDFFAAVRGHRQAQAHLLRALDRGLHSLACELQRDWARQETVPQIVEIVLNERLLKE
jgi:hypothetical protein